jgi:hypothetical protein
MGASPDPTLEEATEQGTGTSGGGGGGKGLTQAEQPTGGPWLGH